MTQTILIMLSVKCSRNMNGRGWVSFRFILAKGKKLVWYKFVMSLFVYWWCVMTGLGLGASLVCSPLRTEYHQQKTWVVQNKFPDCRNHVTGLAFDFILFFYYLTNMCSFQIWRLQIRKKWSTWMTQRSQSFADPDPKDHPSPAGLAPAWPVARALLGRESQESWTLSLEVLSGYD